MKEIMYFGLEDGLENAFIELDKLGIKEITLEIVEEYAYAVASKLREQGFNAYCILSRNATNSVKMEYKDCFTFVEENDNLLSIKLNDDKGVDDLITRFRKYIPFDLMLAFMDSVIVEKYLISKFENNNIGQKHKIKV